MSLVEAAVLTASAEAAIPAAVAAIPGALISNVLWLRLATRFWPFC